MSDHRGGVWGAREDAVWWPGAVAADQQTLHQQFMQQQQQLAVQQQQQQQQQVAQHQAQAIQQQNDAAAAAAHQLFSYKMASTFQHPTTTQSSNQMPEMRYDYRIAGNSAPTQSAPPQPQWWYSNSMDNSMQNSLVNQNNMQNMSPVHTPPPVQSQVQSSIQQQQAEAQVRQQQHQQAVEAHRQQEVQRHQAEAQARQQAEAHIARQQTDAQLRHQNQQQNHQSHQNNQHTQTILQNHQHQRLLAPEHEQQKIVHNLNTPVQVPTRGRMPRGGKLDPRPRGRMTAYAFFVQTCREEHKKKHPEENVVFAEFSKKCAERWKTMLDKEKKRFHEMAEKDKKRYDAEMQHYTPPEGKKQRGKKRKQVKDPNAPKRSLSAFFWFCNDERGKVKGQNPEYGVGDIAKELGKRWADANAEVKSKYEALAEKDKARYEKEMTAYKKKNNPALQPGTMGADEDDEDEDIDEDEDD